MVAPKVFLQAPEQGFSKPRDFRVVYFHQKQQAHGCTVQLSSSYGESQGFKQGRGLGPDTNQAGYRYENGERWHLDTSPSERIRTVACDA